MDDGEHGGGRALLKLMEKSEIHNRVILVARIYHGEHIGKKCFEGITSAAKSAISRSTFNEVTRCHQFPWSPTEWKDGTDPTAECQNGTKCPSGILLSRGGICLPQHPRESDQEWPNHLSNFEWGDTPEPQVEPPQDNLINPMPVANHTQSDRPSPTAPGTANGSNDLLNTATATNTEI